MIESRELMTHLVDCPSLVTPEVADDVWARAVFDELIGVIGVRKANEIARRFRSDLSNRFADPANRESLRRDAHAVISTSAFLGFARLSEAARNLETACEIRESFERDREAFAIARVEAITALNGWIAFQTGT